jgi:hypothetical protein
MHFSPPRLPLPRAARAFAAAMVAAAALATLPSATAAQTNILQPVIPLSSL